MSEETPTPAPGTTETTAPAAGQPTAPPETAPEGQPPEVTPEADEDAQGDEGTAPGDQLGKARKDAAKYRERLRDTETERDAAHELLARTRQSIVDAALEREGIDPRLLATAGHSVESLLDDNGVIDQGKLSEVITTVRREFKVSTGFKPNRGQGMSGVQPEPAPAGLAAAFQPRRR